MIDVSGAIDALMSGTYSVTRYTKGGYVLGRYVPGSVSTFDIEACIEPAGAEDVLRLPEGVRDRKAITVFSRTALQHARQDAPKSDRITWENDIFEIGAVDEWNEQGNYCKAVATKIEDQRAGPPAVPVVDTLPDQPAGTVTVTGTCEVGTVTICVYFDGDLKTEVQAGVTTWTAEIAETEAGVYSVTATASDQGGTSDASIPSSLTVT